jgi:dihydrofolate reductase
MGRVTYEEMAQAWPTSGSPLAPMNEIPKVVFSRTLPSADNWPETRIARGDTAEETARLKEEPGGEIIARGGTSFVRSLIELELACSPAGRSL